jgi:hypothetical protein
MTFNGEWGRQGYTRVCLETARGSAVESALLAAWGNVAPKQLVERYDEEHHLS